MIPELQWQLAERLDEFLSATVAAGAVALLLLGLMLGWWLRGRDRRETARELGQLYGEQIAAEKTRATRAERDALRVQVDELRDQVALYRRGDMARDSVLGGFRGRGAS